MHILLINANPVVSRLLVLCTRDDAVVLDDVSVVADVQSSEYDIVFVDEASYGRDVADLLVTFGSTKKVFISYRSDDMRGFDVTIKKPFLPSQITDIIKEVEVSTVETELKEDVLLIEDEEREEEIPHIFPLSSDEMPEEKIEEVKELSEPTVLDGDEIEKIKALLDMDDDEDILEEILSDEALESRKVELIKEQLIADGLEIVEEDDIVEELSVNLDGTLKKHSDIKNKKIKAKQKNKKNKSKKIKFTEENMEHIEDAVEMAMATMTKKQMKKLLKGKEIEVRIKLEDNH
jgi:hypothetical protein